MFSKCLKLSLFLLFVVLNLDANVLGVFESKVNTSGLSNGQKLFFVDGDAGVLSGANAGQFKGLTLDPQKVQTGVFRWNSKSGKYKLE